MNSLLSVAFAAITMTARVASSSPIPGDGSAQLEIVNQFPNFTWIENMAVRSNGQILANDISAGQVYLIDPQNPRAIPPIVAQFPNGTHIFGSVEVAEGVFYIPSVQGDLYTFDFLPNTTAVWELDMGCYNEGGQASLRQIIEIPEAGLINGMALLSQEKGTILMADSALGVVWRLNVYTGEYTIVFDDPLLKPVQGAPVEFGVNGVHVLDSILYFTNTDLGILAKVPISCNGIPTGSPVNISTSVPAADDFAIDDCGNFWVAENVQNTFVRVTPDGVVQTIAGGTNSSALIGPVAAVFGRGTDDRDILYISTDGLTEDATGTVLTSNGKIVSLDTTAW